MPHNLGKFHISSSPNKSWDYYYNQFTEEETEALKM